MSVETSNTLLKQDLDNLQKQIQSELFELDLLSQCQTYQSSNSSNFLNNNAFNNNFTNFPIQLPIEEQYEKQYFQKKQLDHLQQLQQLQQIYNLSEISAATTTTASNNKEQKSILQKEFQKMQNQRKKSQQRILQKNNNGSYKNSSKQSQVTINNESSNYDQVQQQNQQVNKMEQQQSQQYEEEEEIYNCDETNKENYQQLLNQVDKKICHEFSNNSQTYSQKHQQKNKVKQQNKKQVLQENQNHNNNNNEQLNQYQFKPCLSKKSLQIAQKLENPKIRLLNSKQKFMDKIKKLQQEKENQYSFRPEINEKYNNYFDDDSYFYQPRWQKLYDLYHQQQIENQQRRVIRERELDSNPDLTFQPNTINSKKSWYYYGENEYDVIDRCFQWLQKKEERLNQARKLQNELYQRDCTFHPKTYSNDDCLFNLFNCQDDVSEFNKKGILEFFERVELANKRKKEIQERQNKNQGDGWQNKITIPKEFNFMKKQNNQLSEYNVSPDFTQRKSYNQSQYNNYVCSNYNNNYNNKAQNTDHNNKIMLFYKTRSKSTNNLLCDNDILIDNQCLDNKNSLNSAYSILHEKLMSIDL